MSIIKLAEPYAVTYLRNQVRDSLSYHGEEAIALQLVHTITDPDAERCPRCTDDTYQDGEEQCPVCFGVSFIDPVTKSGVKLAKRVWAQFGDHTVTENRDQHGVWNRDDREVQLEAFPLLEERDVVVRIKEWDITTHTPLVVGGFYIVQAMTRSSLRTGGNRYSQSIEDVYGQKCTCSLLGDSSGITNYPIVGVAFPDVGIIGTPTPEIVAQPDTKVVFVPGTDGSAPAPNSGSVLGAALEWKAVFTYTQNVPATVWTINHTLTHRPQVTIWVGDEIVEAQVDTDTPGEITITFAEPQEGYAEIS
jgi:hypothetical protein